MPIRVYVVDDSDVFLDALRELFAACPEYELVGEAHNGEIALSEVPRLAPDLVLLDVILPGIDGVETSRRLHELRPATQVILTSVGEDPRTAPAGRAEAAFLSKARISPQALREAWHGRGQEEKARGPVSSPLER